MAVSIKSPLLAIGWFFIAVLAVIAGTYMIFISGSVMLCRILQKNKRYYYRKNHFVSVSSMVYRMKRNGAGLASICVLSTMVLVMILGAAAFTSAQRTACAHATRKAYRLLRTIIRMMKKRYTPPKKPI